MTDEVDDFLAHFGVKGMHWGVRKRSDGSPVQYETAASGKRDSAPKGGSSLSSGRMGFAGTRENLARAASKQGAKDRQARKAWEKQTGHKTNMKNFRHNPLDPIRTDYTTSEIKASRARVKEAWKRIDASSKSGKDYADRIADRKLASISRDSVIADHKTIGQRTVATLLFGPIGYVATDFNHPQIF